MAGVTDFISIINSILKTATTLGIVGLVGAGAWLGYNSYYENELTLAENKRQIAELQEDLQVKERKIERLDTALRLLKVDHRLAQLRVLDQAADPSTGRLVSKINFVEINDDGHPIDQAKEFVLQGDIVYVDHWVVKFADEYVEQADLDRATSICLFRRIFGEFQEPADGFVLDRVGSRPNAYARGGEASDFEKQIWDDFWNIANDPQRAEALGIRAAHGEAVSTKLRKGQTYLLHLRASGGLSITPASNQKPISSDPSA